MKIKASSKEKEPTHHASLTDGKKMLGIIFSNSKGDRVEGGYQANPYPRTALKTQQGNSKYSDYEEPYFASAQDDFSGGRAHEDFESDTSKYNDASFINPMADVGLMLGTPAFWSKGFKSCDYVMPTTSIIDWTSLADGYALARSFVSSAAYTAGEFYLLVRKVGNPTGSGTFKIWNNSGGEPGTTKWQKTFDPTTLEENISGWVRVADATSISNATTYWVGMVGHSSWDATNYVEIAVMTGTGKGSDDAESTWGNVTGLLPFYIGVAEPEFAPRFFDYKGAVYMIKQHISGTSACNIYVNGDRGVADGGNVERLIDATKSWDTNQFAGGVVLLTKGKGSTEYQPWRRIVSNTSTYLVVDEDWQIDHDTTTEYVILGTDSWTFLGATTSFLTDVEVSGEWVYMAQGSGFKIQRYRWYNNGGVWTAAFATEDVYAEKLLAIRHPDSGEMIYGALNAHRFHNAAIWRGSVPDWDDKLYYDLGEMAPTNKGWFDVPSDVLVTQSTTEGHTKIAIAAGHTTGVAAAVTLDNPLDISRATKIRFWVKSNIALNSGDYRLAWSDNARLERTRVAFAVRKADVSGATPSYTDLPYTHDGDTDTENDVTLTTNDWLYVCAPFPFRQINVTMGTTKNIIDTGITWEVFDGETYANHTVFTDTTISTGTKRLGQSGSIHINIRPNEWEPGTVDGSFGYWARIQYTSNLTAAIDIQEITVTADDTAWVAIPALTAGAWTRVVASYNPTAYPPPDDRAIQSVGLYVATDKGASVIEIKDIMYYSEGVDSLDETVFNMPDAHRIIDMQAYSGSQDQPRKNPWIFTEGPVYELQTQNNNQIVPMPLEELAALQSPLNGVAHTVNGPYLFFSLGPRLERYFNRTLDDIGPNRNLGLPSDRYGNISSLATYPGAVYASIDAKSGTSSVLKLDGESWHEVYRSQAAAKRVRSIHIQSIDGLDIDRLWIGEGNDVKYMTLSLAPHQDPEYTFRWEGHLITSYNYANLLDVRKIWKSLKTHAENLSSGVYAAIDYQIDDESSWTEIGNFDETPVKDLDLNAVTPRGRRVRYRLRLRTNDASETPRLKAIVSEGVAFVKVKYRFTFTLTLTESDLDIDLEGDDNTEFTAQQKHDMILDWANEGEALKWNVNYSIHDNRLVYVDPPSVSPITKIYDEGTEKYVATLSVIDA